MATIKLDKEHVITSTAKSSFAVQVSLFNSEIKGNIFTVEAAAPSAYTPSLDFSIKENSQYLPLL